MNKKLLATLSLSALIIGAGIALTSKKPVEVEAYSAYTEGSLPTTIKLNDNTPEQIRSYYNELLSLDASEKTGTNLLKNLKPILKNNQKYFSYDSSSSKNAIWRLYEIVDRDWVKSPASSTVYGTYNEATNTLSNYQYGSSSNVKNNPYVHALYINRDVVNQTQAWGNHNQDEWGINQEHIWAKSNGFETAGAGGARGDPMHLWAGNGNTNREHSNDYFGYVDKTKSYKDMGNTYSNQSGNYTGTSLTNGTTKVFEPQDCDKGDIARAVFYMAARYNDLAGDEETIDGNEPNLELVDSGTAPGSGYQSSKSVTGKMGLITDLLEWNRLDPPDTFEIHRNNLLYNNYTLNRNPFIDFPEWAEFIWGDGEGIKYANPTNDVINGFKKDESIPATGVSLDRATLSLDLFNNPKQATLVATVEPNDATNKQVTWESSNENVATVSPNGLVSAVGIGNATITVTTVSGEHTATCTVIVTDHTPIVTSVTLSQYSANLDVDRVDEVQLTATVNGDYDPPASVTWETSNDGVATVSDSGLVCAIAVGSATITATSTYDDTKSASCTITVSDSAVYTDTITYSKIGYSGTSGYSDKTDVKDITNTYYSINSCKNSSNYIQIRASDNSGIVSTDSVGALVNVSVTFNLNDNNANKKIDIYGNDNEYTAPSNLYSKDASVLGTKIATFEYDSKNRTVSQSFSIEDRYLYVGARSSSGAVWIDEISFSWKDPGVYVATTGVSLDSDSATIGMNETVTLTPTVTPNDATFKGVTWASSDERVALVSSTGVVTGVSAGSATITVGTKDGHFTDCCEITVTSNPKYKTDTYADGVPYKMYLQNKGYFDGGVGKSDYFGTTTPEYEDGVNVYFETVNSYKRVYFMSGGERKYIVAYLNNTYKNFGIKTVDVFTDGTTVYEWTINANGYLVAMVESTSYTLGLKKGQDFTTFALNATAQTNRFMKFEYTAESYASDFLTEIACDPTGVNAPDYGANYSWNDFKAIYQAMDTNQKQLLEESESDENGTIIERAIARYEYIVWKYQIEDFLNRNVPQGSGRLNVSTSSSNNMITIVIAAASVVSLIGIGLLLTKKKER